MVIIDFACGFYLWVYEGQQAVIFKCTDVHLHDNAVKHNTAAILADRRSLAGSNMSDLEEFL